LAEGEPGVASTQEYTRQSIDVMGQEFVVVVEEVQQVAARAIQGKVGGNGALERLRRHDQAQ
jgi:hypothetical protein